MGESCADALEKYPGHTVLHVNGGFHSAYWDGTVHQLRLRKPNANIRTVAAVPTANPAVEEVRGEPEADFIAFVEASRTDLNEEMYSVYGQQQIKYRLHIPPAGVARPSGTAADLPDGRRIHSQRWARSMEAATR